MLFLGQNVFMMIKTLDLNCIKGPSKNINIFMTLQTIHFFSVQTPSPPSIQTNIFESTIWVSSNITFVVQQQKLTLISSLFDM